MIGVPECGLALLLDDSGTILQVTRNDLNLPEAVPTRLFIRLVDAASRIKAMNFLAKIKENSAAFNWEMNVMLSNGTEILHFFGGRIGEQILVVAAADNDLASKLYEDLMYISNAYANLTRATNKTDRDRDRAEPGASLYDEISQLNNELMTLQRELAKKNAELERLNALKNQFLGMAAHDLRSPLGAIIGYSEFLLDETAGTLNPEHREFLSIIRTSSDFMLALIEDFLDVSMIESGRLELNLKPVDLIPLLEKNLAINRMLAGKKHIMLSLHSHASEMTLLLDAARIEQVMNNLISNAVKFSYPESEVSITVMKSDDPAVPAHLALAGPLCYAVIAVQDRGQGIPADEVDKLFNMYTRSSVRSTGGEKSTGLGLAITRRIVEGHHGKILIDSQVGRGTTLLVLLPFDL